nr:sigma 54-interacting transcriptional regulator [Desulfobotulus pelophilus]
MDGNPICSPDVTTGSKAARECLLAQGYDLIIIDDRNTGPPSGDILQEIAALRPAPTVILIRPEASVLQGLLPNEPLIHEIIGWPPSPASLQSCLRRALERCLLISEKNKLEQHCRCHTIFSNIAGHSTSMKELMDTLTSLAEGKGSILITGESGTGKELAARALHSLSERSAGPFRRLHCPSMSEDSLLEDLCPSSATKKTETSFEKAKGGTLFLDEIANIGPAVQEHLEYLMTAGPPDTPRILMSTNQDLSSKTETKLFRSSLYEKIRAGHLHLPPLRKRPEDIPPLAHYLLEKQCHKLKKPGKSIAPELMKRLMAHPWEGNIRELENTIIHGILFSSTQKIGTEDVQLSGPRPVGPCSAALHQANYKDAKEEALKGFNQIYIGRLLKRSKGNISLAARACGLERQALQQIMKRYDISPGPYRPRTGCEGGYPD